MEQPTKKIIFWHEGLQSHVEIEITLRLSGDALQSSSEASSDEFLPMLAEYAHMLTQMHMETAGIRNRYQMN